MCKEKKFLFIFIVLLLQSCADMPRNPYYIPNESNSLLLAQKNEIKVAVSTINLNNKIDSPLGKFVNAQIGYSPIKHLGIYANHLRWNRSAVSNGFDWGNNYEFDNIALGGYYLFQTESIKNRNLEFPNIPIGILTDFYLGYGKGKVSNIYPESDESFYNFTQPYGQLGIHWRDKNFGLSWIFQVGRINFANGRYDVQQSAAQRGLFTYENILADNSFRYRASTYKIFAGSKSVRTYLTLTIADSSLGDRQYYLPHGTDMASAGVVLNIDHAYRFLFKKGKNKKARNKK